MLFSVPITAAVSFFWGGGERVAHAEMMAFVFRKNSHVDYDSHTSYTCLHLFLLGVAAVCSPLLSIRYEQEHCAAFSCVEGPSVGMLYMAESLQDMWLFLCHFAVAITDPVSCVMYSCCVSICVISTHRRCVLLQSWGKHWTCVLVT